MLLPNTSIKTLLENKLSEVRGRRDVLREFERDGFDISKSIAIVLAEEDMLCKILDSINVEKYY